MKRFLISNPNSTDNQFARITINSDTSIVNTGVEGAWLVTEKQNDFCLAPRPPLPVGERGSVEGLTIEGTFIVEIDGVVIPYSLTHDQLTQVYRPGNTYGIVIEKRLDGLFDIRNTAKKQTEVRIFRTSKTGMFLDGSGSFSALDVLGVEFGVSLSVSLLEISCVGVDPVAEIELEGLWDIEVNGVRLENVTVGDDGTVMIDGIEIIDKVTYEDQV